MIKNSNLSLRNVINIMSQQALTLDRSNLINFLSNQNKFFENYIRENNHEERQHYYIKLLDFLKKAMEHCTIRLQDKHLNPLRLIVDLMQKVYSQNIGCSLQQKILIETQNILQIMYKKLTNNIENERVITESGKNNRAQIEHFRELFKGTKVLFSLNLNKNLQIFYHLSLEILNESSHIIWFHLMSEVLPEEQEEPNEQRTEIIIKFLNYAYINRNIASLHYIQTIILELINSFLDGTPSCYLWIQLQKRLNISFDNFLHKVVDYILSLFYICDENLILMSQEVLKLMFWKLGLKQYKYMSEFYNILQNIASNINETAMGRSDFSNLRMNFFSSFSSIWVNEGRLSHLYRIFGIISERLNKNQTLVDFYKYLVDLTGILSPIEYHESFKVMGELIYNNLQILLPQFLGSEDKRNLAFNQPAFSRAFIKFIYELISDQFYRLRYSVQSQLSIKLQILLKPYLIQMLCYNYPIQLFQVWIKFLQLNPMSEPLPLHFTMKTKGSMYYQSLIRQYFENLHRFTTQDQLMQIYNFVDDSTEKMLDWWEQIINRNYKPKIDLMVIAESRPWSTNQQKRRFAKMLYQISKYDQNYWKIQGNPTENQYSQWFVLNISNVKE